MDNSSNQYESLIKQVEQVFSLISHPKLDDIVYHKCEECELIESTFANKNWMTLEDDTIESNYDKLPLLSHKAFHYFFPCIFELFIKKF